MPKQSAQSPRGSDPTVTSDLDPTAPVFEPSNAIADRPVIVSSIDTVPVTVQRPVPQDLEEFIDRPEVERACAAPDRYHPQGLGPHPQRTSLQQHFDYFDINKDGKITIWETFTATRYLHLGWVGPLNWMVSAFIALAVHFGLSYITQDSWIPDPRLIIYTKNAHKSIHGSTSTTWDHEGRYSPARFEAILSKWDREGKDGLNVWELARFVRASWNYLDLLGIIASSGEWALTWMIFKDKDGILHREDMRGMYDGTAFYRMAERNGHVHYGMDARVEAVSKHKMG